VVLLVISKLPASPPIFSLWGVRKIVQPRLLVKAGLQNRYIHFKGEHPATFTQT